MWLLSTARAELKFFPGPKAVPVHTRASTQQHTLSSSRHLVSPKIRGFLTLAERDGYDWAWADTCCIDKTSSAELTEAINSVWHRRGWTLQELLASRVVVFFSKEWSPLGTKFELADLLQDITGIPSEVVRLEKDFTDMSVAARMPWASKRETTRTEDTAYCLFGLFGVNLSTLYGEGQNAFYRLQEEILRTSGDVSLFGWSGNSPVVFASLQSLTGSHPRVDAVDADGPGRSRCRSRRVRWAGLGGC
ncbi:uncharacterized protein BXZ73DRAFT_92106 [Epithele typhae]|uniref:uncharacterized protein n=1 Tax=Epithele typhae TaxID=378194 RepID=UPI00200841DA|nr:uncharacterized protein BXZ73DRAFT_92106 [Epithele typhae]KAH9919167.1 hypothetical protein BXZ73DRAFT_92106 [Epithele typhae]